MFMFSFVYSAQLHSAHVLEILKYMIKKYLLCHNDYFAMTFSNHFHILI